MILRNTNAIVVLGKQATQIKMFLELQLCFTSSQELDEHLGC